jgi:hypothetical protein
MAEVKLKSADWYYDPPHGASQPEIDRAVVLLERNGFYVDVPYLDRQAELARADERKQLDYLEAEYKNAVPSVARDAHPDKIWSSAVKLDYLIDGFLGLEPSPIWKKGEVPSWKGERKYDSVALEYLGNKYPEYRGLLHGITKLRQIRGSIKYLSKLPNFADSTGLIHPTYGPSSDADDKYGAVTGRNGMKNPEGHQIPNSKEKDAYNIRKGFIAPYLYKLVVRDYSAQEVVILAWIVEQLTGNRDLYKAVEMGGKFHSMNARNVFGKRLKWVHPGTGKRLDEYSLEDFETDSYLKDRRRDSKTVWYGAQFRKTGRGFGYTLLDANGQPVGEDVGNDVLLAFLEENPGLQLWYDWVDNYFKKHPYIAESNGRIRDFSELLEELFRYGKLDWKYRKACRAGGNMPIQGTGASMKNAAIVSAFNHRRLVEISTLQMEVHDELVWRCPPEHVEEVLMLSKEVMENSYPIHCATSGGVGINWAEAK